MSKSAFAFGTFAFGTAALAILTFADSSDAAPAQAAAAVPDFAADSSTSWVLDRTVDDLLAPAAGPGPITFETSSNAIRALAPPGSWVMSGGPDFSANAGTARIASSVARPRPMSPFGDLTRGCARRR